MSSNQYWTPDACLSEDIHYHLPIQGHHYLSENKYINSLAKAKGKTQWHITVMIITDLWQKVEYLHYNIKYLDENMNSKWQNEVHVHTWHLMIDGGYWTFIKSIGNCYLRTKQYNQWNIIKCRQFSILQPITIDLILILIV